MKKTIVERILDKRWELGKNDRPLPIEKCASQIDISLSSFRSVLKYGELSVGDTIRPKIEGWLAK